MALTTATQNETLCARSRRLMSDIPLSLEVSLQKVKGPPNIGSGLDDPPTQVL